MNLFVLLTLTLTGLWNHESEGQTQPSVRVFSLQKGLWTVPANDVFLRYNFSKNEEPAQELTLCYRIKFETFVTTTMHFSYGSSEEKPNALTIFNRQTRIRSWFNNKPQTETQKKEWAGYPDVWHHLCHVYHDGTYTIYWQGQEFFRGNLSGSLPLDMNGSLIIGQEQDSLSGGFDSSQILRGDITQIDLWNRRLTSSQVLEMASCKNSVDVGNIFTSSEAKFEIFGNIEETRLPLSDLCRVTPRYTVLPEERSFAASTALCRLLNASQAVPSSAAENDVLHSTVVPFFGVCTPSASWKVWIGITDVLEDGVWRNDHTQDVVTYLNFSSLYPTSSTYTNCAEMLTNGLWTVDTCEPTAKRCSACYTEESDFLYLRGLCFDNEHESRFYVSGYVNERPLFRGYYNYVIMWEKENLKWLLRDTIANVTVAQLHVADIKAYPLGLNKWTLEQAMCGQAPNMLVTLSLSPCSPDHFMCKSGACVSIHLRCNLKYECEDGSDEDGCDIVVLSDHYRDHLAPSGVNGSMLEILPSVTINRVASIDELNQAVTLEFEIDLTWSDNRLNFKFLEVSKKGAVLSKKDISKIWQPDYQLTNLEGGRVQELSKTVVVQEAENPSFPSFNSINMDLIYPGSANKMTISQRYTGTFTCSFELYTYPFDVQTCSIDISLPAAYNGYVQFSSDAVPVDYSGKEELALFSIKNSRFYASAEKRSSKAMFELHRRQGVILMATFMPSILLLLVSWSTLFVKMEALNVRAMMSLTALLVLYTLFAQLSSSLPKTATIKLIDIWFFFIIFLLFSNIVIHIFCEYLGSSKSNVEPQSNLPAKFLAKPLNIQMKRPPPAKILVYQRSLFIPVAFVIFNIVFWWQVFGQ